MIPLETIFELTQPHVAAASGLLKLENTIYVVADDENELMVYDLLTQEGKSFPIVATKLPEQKELRKKLKKDFEAMTLLADGKILIVPSGSTSEREMGALMSVSGERLQLVSFSALYQELRKSLDDLNIEGVLSFGKDLIFLQRGNGSQGANAVIQITLSSLMNQQLFTPVIKILDLGELDGVKLTFTDGVLAQKTIIFLAVAEDTQSTYFDGEFKGAVIGLMSLDGVILNQARLALSSKPEGLAYNLEDFSFYVVTDDDNRLKASKLLQGFFPSEWKRIIV